jgi:quinol monooxygenase YgiN
MSFVLVVRMKIAEGNEERAAELIPELARASRTEPGCELYIPCRDPEDPRSYLFYEQYRDKAAFEEHGASEHFQRLAAGELFGLTDGARERTFYETVVD